MKMQLHAQVYKKNSKNGMTYVNAIDLDKGGLIDFSIPGGEQIKIGDELHLDAIVEPNKGKYGLYLKIVDLVKTSTNK